ncbi:HAMP domain-containing sensor histidine kinase [Lederbergia citrea]|uniref:Signal transduction histidine-protein kinase ArlS n=2 Tax=Lederbergia citrea TaxID=2833581 RepID=A0A942UTH3_9BACI|nr:HAMP domain-containing histidine kinase [Lederbergia citrea]MBS4177843.1 HAMP domain-containing protein [Lederbergia citrea]MBS4204517.1 HAMP domain-containing protein [Lederbergia citrea]MBS4223639.1 HAMP domain-containing protein [Lederbergia citrea]
MKLTRKLIDLNIKWKLTLWSSCLMILLFFSYNLFQYFFIQNWLIAQEKQTIQTRMDEVLAYLKDTNHAQNGLDIQRANDFLDKINQESQMIRLLNQKGEEVFSTSDDFPEDEIKPKLVNRSELDEVKINEDRILVLRAPFNEGTVEIGRSLEKSDELMKYFFFVMIAGGIGATGLSLLGGRLISHQLLKSVNKIVDTMKRIKKKGLKERVQIGAHKDEITELGMMFNDLMDDLERSFLQQKQFVEDASHELKTPLTIIHGHLSLINRWGKEDPKVLERSIGLSLKEVDRLIQLVAELLELSRADANHQEDLIHFDVIKPNVVIDRVLENVKLINNDFEININREANEHSLIKIPSRYLEQILLIAFDNAVKFAKDKKVIDVRTVNTGNLFTIEIKDYGIGIPKEDLPFVLNRFYRVDKARSRKSGGSGLGLSIAKRLVENYGGNLLLTSSEGKWTQISIQLPLVT